jgi:hypothetical protein
MHVHEYSIDVRPDSREFSDIVKHLVQNGHVALLRETAAIMKEKTGMGIAPEEFFAIPHPGRSISRSGSVLGMEVFCQQSCYLFLISPMEDLPEMLYDRFSRYAFQDPTRFRRLQMGIASKGEMPKEILEKFQLDVVQAIKNHVDGRKLRGKTFEWIADPPFGRGLALFLGESTEEGVAPRFQYTEALYSPEELACVAVLEKNPCRRMLQSVLTKGRILSEVAAQNGESAAYEELFQCGLLRREHLVSCVKEGKPLTHVPSREHLANTTIGQLPCPECGRKFAEEKIEEILIPTEMARELTSGSKWMQVWLTRELERNHIPVKDVKWNLHVEGGEEIDVVTSIFGNIVFFELKDREFGLGDIYPFIYRMERYAADHGMIVTTEKVSGVTKTYIEERSRKERDESLGRVTYSEGIEESRRKIVQFVALLTRNYIGMRLRGFSPRVSLERIITS